MDKKDNRSSEREPEGNSFDYEELVNEPAEDQDYEEYREEDDFDEDEEVVFRFRPWMIPVFAGMMILAILICIPLWKLSSHSGGAGDSDALVTATEAQTTEAAGIQETVMPPELSTEPISTPEPTATPTETPQATPAATPEATIQPTEEPAATEIPNANSAGNALAEGNAMRRRKCGGTAEKRGDAGPYRQKRFHRLVQTGIQWADGICGDSVSDHGPCVQDSGKTVEPESCQHSGRQSDRICGL